MQFIPFTRKYSVTCTRVHDGKEIPFVTITDEGNEVFVQIHKADDPTKYEYWFRVKKDKFFGMMGSLWPDDVAILNCDPPNND